MIYRIQEKFSATKIILGDNEDANFLYEKLLFNGKKQVVEMTHRIMNCTRTLIKQDEHEAPIGEKEIKKMGK